MKLGLNANARSAACLTLAAVLLALVGSLLFGCSSTPADSSLSDAAHSQEDAGEAGTPLRIASMKGPTSIGLAAMMEDDAQASYDFQVFATADEIAPKLASGEVDIALLPINLAATLYHRTEGGIKAIDVNTLGVLYGLTADDALKGGGLTMADLAGRTIYMTGKGTVPEYTVRALLAKAGLSEEDVTLEFRSEPAEVVALLAADASAVGIVPQPFATSAVAQDASLANVLDLTEQWDLLAADGAASLAEGSRFVTGVTVVRSASLEERPDAVARFLEDHRASARIAADDPAAIADAVVELGIIPNAAIAETAIPLCNVVCLDGEEMQAAISGYLQELLTWAPDAIAGGLPDDGFYHL